MAVSTALTEAEAVVKQLQDYNPASLAREDLSPGFNFSNAVAPASRLVDLFRRISLSALPDFPQPPLTAIRDHGQQVLSIFDEIKEFSFEKVTNNPTAVRNEIIQRLSNIYDSTWTALFSYIGYSAGRTSDFKKLEVDARQSMDAVQEAARVLTGQLQGYETQAKGLLEEVRKVAAEQGVSQQAHYFKSEADSHSTEAKEWRKWTLIAAAGLALYAALTIFMWKLPWLASANTQQTAQIITGKVLLFVVLSYLVLLCAKNFLSHKHNSIVNRHRQNALLTFNALAQAASTPAVRDVILGHASVCIFSPQETGYAKGTSTGEASTLPQALVSLITKTEAKQ